MVPNCEDYQMLVPDSDKTNCLVNLLTHLLTQFFENFKIHSVFLWTGEPLAVDEIVKSIPG